MDSNVAALAGAAIGALAGLIGTVAALANDWRRDRNNWRRDQRVRSTVEFLREARRVDLMISRAGRIGEEGDTLPEPNWRTSIAMHLAEIELYGSKELAEAGQRVYQSLNRLEEEWASLGSMMQMDETVSHYRRTLQRDLGLPVTDLAFLGPPPTE